VLKKGGSEMSWNAETLGMVYDKTEGYCRYCGKRVCWKNYGRQGERGAWEIDHSVPIALGGTDNLRNLWPACIECNRDKSTMTGPEYMRLFEEPDEGLSLGDLVWSVVKAIALAKILSAIRGNSRT
jgi:CRISPR/Cas system Type II protein with McrA/HNH and RuvC-like nuclease domain